MQSTLNSQPPSASIVLTDAPRIVELKREFCRLDMREEELRPFLHHAAALDELNRVRARKQAIAAQIFRP